MECPLYPPKADIAARDRHVRFVPLADMQLEPISKLPVAVDPL
jgi:hypothetical protein